MYLSITTLNCCGCSTPFRNKLLLSVLLTFTFDLIFLQEINVRDLNPVLWSSWPYLLFHSFRSIRAGGGVAIAVRKSVVSLFSRIQVRCEFSGYFLYIVLHHREVTLHIINVYIPHIPAFRSEVLDLFEQTLLSIPSSDLLVVGGDFNCTLDPAIDRVPGTEGHHTPASRVRRLVTRFALSDVFRIFYPAVASYTYFTRGRRSGSAARLDRFYVSDPLRASLFSVEHLPTQVSDHHMVHLVLNLRFKYHRVSRWSFNSDFLTLDAFVQAVSSFFGNIPLSSGSPGDRWLSIKAAFRSMIMHFCHSSAVRRSMLKARLRFQIRHTADSQHQQAYQSVLHSQVVTDAKQAAFRCLRDKAKFIDNPSDLFFTLERTKHRARTIISLRKPDGTLTSDRLTICGLVRDYYLQLFSPAPEQPVLDPRLTSGLPQLSAAQAELLDRDITLPELQRACSCLRPGRTPGPDGIPVEIYRDFLPQLSPILLDVYNSLPFSVDWLPLFLVAQISLLPKKRDLQCLDNWRPICLSNVDYKILTKIMALRLSMVLATIIHPSQTCAVPGRSLYTSLHTIKNLMYLAKARREDLALLNLDQAKAFDRVNHDYLWFILHAFGVGRRFIKCLQLLYLYATARVYGGDFVTADFPFQRGVRQGCPLSSILFIIALEPFLHLLKNTFLEFRLARHIRLPVTHTIPYTAYADDVTVMIRHHEEFQLLESSYEVYAKASNAQVNRQKCSGLWWGTWRRHPSSPWNTTWSSEGMVVLGVPFGTPGFCRVSVWPPVLAKVQSRVHQWLYLREFLSLQGRVQVCNVYLSSLMWHLCHIYTPPKYVLRKFDQSVRRLLWYRVNWVSVLKLRRPYEAGGLQLDHFSHRITALRIRHVLDVVQRSDPILSDLTDCIFLRYRKGFPLAGLIRLRNLPAQVGAVGKFYLECLACWFQLRAVTSPSDDPLYEPLFGSVHLPPFVVSRPVEPTTWSAFGILYVKDLFHPDGTWRCFSDLASPLWRSSARNKALWLRFRLRLLRLLPYVFSPFRCLLPLPLPSFPSFSSLTIDGFSFDLATFSLRSLYRIFQSRLLPTPSILPQSSTLDTSVWSYSRPKLCRGRESDAHWRFLHGALPTAPKLFLFHLRSTSLCNFCFLPGSCLHEYLDCVILFPLLLSVRRFASTYCGFFHTNSEYLSLVSDGSRPTSFSPSKSHVMCRFLFVLVKYVIYSYRLYSRPLPLPTAQVELVDRFYSVFLQRVNLEYAELAHTTRHNAFFQVWDPGGFRFRREAYGLRWRQIPR